MIFRNSSVSSQTSDLREDGSEYGYSFLFEAVGYSPKFYDIGHSCSGSQISADVETTVTTTVKSVSNKTACQYEIVNLQTLVTIIDTPQLAGVTSASPDATFIAKV